MAGRRRAPRRSAPRWISPGVSQGKLALQRLAHFDAQAQAAARLWGQIQPQGKVSAACLAKGPAVGC